MVRLDWIFLLFDTAWKAEDADRPFDGHVLIVKALARETLCSSFAHWVQIYITSSWRACSVLMMKSFSTHRAGKIIFVGVIAIPAV